MKMEHHLLWTYSAWPLQVIIFGHGVKAPGEEMMGSETERQTGLLWDICTVDLMHSTHKLRRAQKGCRKFPGLASSAGI